MQHNDIRSSIGFFSPSIIKSDFLSSLGKISLRSQWPQPLMVLNQWYYIIPLFPDFSSKYQFSLNFPWPFPGLWQPCITLLNRYTYTISECVAVLTLLGDAFSTAFSALAALCKKLPLNCGEPPEMTICLRLWGEPRIPYGSGLTRSSGWVSSSDWKKNDEKLIY